jgi:hypothetical protein
VSISEVRRAGCGNARVTLGAEELLKFGPNNRSILTVALPNGEGFPTELGQRAFDNSITRYVTF